MATLTDLGRLVKQKHPGAYDDLPDSTLGAMVQKKYPGSYDDFTPDMPQTQTPARSNPTLALGKRAVALSNDAAGAIPGGLGMLGGLVPGPPGYALAPLMAGGGEALRQGITGQPFDPRSIGAEAAKAEGAQLLGGAISKFALDPLAHMLMRGAVRPTAKLLQEFPTVIDDMRRAGVGVTKGGIAKATGRRQMASLASEELRLGAQAQGMTRKVSDLIPQTADLIPQGTAKLGEARTQVQKLAARFRRDYPGPLNPTLLKKIKQDAQSEAAAVLNAVKRKEPVLPGAHVEARFWDAVAKNADDALSTIPGHKAAERVTQKAIGVERAAQKGHLADLTGAPRVMAGAVGRGVPVAIGAGIGYRKAGVPGAVAGATAGAVASGQSTLSRAALILSNPFLLQLASQLPPHLAAMLFAPPDTTSNPQPNAAKGEQ